MMRLCFQACPQKKAGISWRPTIFNSHAPKRGSRRKPQECCKRQTEQGRQWTTSQPTPTCLPDADKPPCHRTIKRPQPDQGMSDMKYSQSTKSRNPIILGRLGLKSLKVKMSRPTRNYSGNPNPVPGIPPTLYQTSRWIYSLNTLNSNGIPKNKLIGRHIARRINPINSWAAILLIYITHNTL